MELVPFKFDFESNPRLFSRLDSDFEYVSGKTLSPKDKAFGATGGGVSSDRNAIAAAVAYAKTTGAKLTFPAGIYLINTDEGSIELEDVALEGTYVLDGYQGLPDPSRGAIFYIIGTTNPAFLVGRGVSIRGLAFFYPDQIDNAAPIVYPPMLDFDFSNGPVQYVYFDSNVVYNAYRFCRINDAAGAVGHCWFTNNTVYGVLTCIEITRNLETIHITGNDFTFGAWLHATEGGIRAFTRLNGQCIKYDQGDGLYMHDNLVFGYLTGVAIGAGNALAQLSRIVGNAFDQCRYGVSVSGTGNFTASLIDSNTFYSVNPQNTALQAISIRINNSGAAVTESLTISGNNFALATEDHIHVSGALTTRNILVSGNSFNNWALDKAAGNYGALNISGALTNFIAVGNSLFGGLFSFFASGILGAANTITAIGNLFNTCLRAINITTNTMTAVGNTSFVTQDVSSDQYTATAVYSVGNNWDKPGYATPFAVPLGQMVSYANDAAAAAAGVPLGGIYRTAGALNIRIV